MNSGERLHRRLGPLALMSLGIGATIGTGLYVSTGIVARDIAGPSIMLSFVARRGWLRIRRTLLFRTGQHGSGGRQCLHLRLRHAR